MTPEEAIEVLSNELIVITDMIGYCKDFEKESDLALAYRVKRQEAHNAAISALKEIQQYREIGTVEQVKNQKENLNVAYQIISDYEQYGTVEEFKMAQRYMRLVNAHGTIGQVIDSCAEYEEIGTVKECREAVEKQKAKKPKDSLKINPVIDGNGAYVDADTTIYLLCPNCGEMIGIDESCDKFCRECGQAIKDEDLEEMEDG